MNSQRDSVCKGQRDLKPSVLERGTGFMPYSLVPLDLKVPGSSSPHVIQTKVMKGRAL